MSHKEQEWLGVACGREGDGVGSRMASHQYLKNRPRDKSMKSCVRICIKHLPGKYHNGLGAEDTKANKV